MADEPNSPTSQAADADSPHVEALAVVGTGTPPTSPNFGVPRYSLNDVADFPTQGNAITDTFDAQAAKRGAIVDADIAAGAAIVKTKLGPLAIVDADVAVGAAIAKAKLAPLDVLNADVDPAAAIAESKLSLATDAAPGTGSRRTLGTGAQQAAPGNDLRFAPVGAQLMYAGVNDPNPNWMICDGRAVGRAAYAALFAVLGTAYGAGDGSTTFNLPDKRGRVSVGAINMGTGAAAADNGHVNAGRGTSGGEVNHALAAGESGMPAHSHGLPGTPATASAWSGSVAQGGTGSAEFPGTNNGYTYNNVSTNNAGAQNAASGHNNVQPYQADSYIIRVL